MGIGSDFARSVVLEQYADKNPFWNPRNYNLDISDLNSVRTPSVGEIQNFQLKKIEEFQNIAMRAKFDKLDGITQSNFNTLLSSFETEEDKEIDQAIENLITAYNSLYFYQVNKDERSNREWKNIQTRLKNVISRLEILINKFGNTSVFLEQELKDLYKAAEEAGLKLNSSEAVNNFLKHINQLKGDTLEELGVLWLKKINAPNIESIRLGSVYLDSESKDKSKSGQLIQDLIAYSVKSPDILNNKMIQYRKTGEKEYTTVSILEFFEAVENANGKNETIHITDETYDVLTRLNSLNVQAKSGKNQKPWNVNKRTSVSISEFSDEVDVLQVGINRTFNLLKSLNNLDKGQEPWLLKDVSDDYQALANYGLATVMNKVLHLSERGNQYLLTPYGFMTYPERVSQLFKTKKHIATIQGTINLTKDLDTSYKVDIK